MIRAKAKYKKNFGISAEGNPEFNIFYSGYICGQQIDREVLVEFYTQLMQYHHLNFWSKGLVQFIDEFIDRLESNLKEDKGD